MKNFIVFSLFFISLSVIVGLYLHIQSLSKTIDIYSTDFQAKVFLENIISNLIEKEISQYKVSNMELKGNLELLNKLKELCINGTIFVFSFGDTSCDVCIDNAFKELSMFPDFEGNEKFIVLTNIRDTKQFKAISNLHNKYLFINVEESLYLDNTNKYMPPMFFILNNGELDPKNLFFYVKEVPELNMKYFEFINSTYFDKI
jgi:hypothetical protein